MINVYIEGPYGNPSVNFENNEYDIFLIITGGIGITPLQSITNELIY